MKNIFCFVGIRGINFLSIKYLANLEVEYKASAKTNLEEKE